jgi:hypothetical protein
MHHSKGRALQPGGEIKRFSGAGGKGLASMDSVR